MNEKPNEKVKTYPMPDGGSSITITNIAYHRNGISGQSFHVVLFTQTTSNPRMADRLMAIVFPEPFHVAVLDTDRLGEGDIAFGSNSWRGDRFEEALRGAISDWEQGRK